MDIFIIISHFGLLKMVQQITLKIGLDLLNTAV